MMDDEYPRPDNGSVLNMAVAAVMLVVAGLGLMVWDDQPESQIVTSALHAP